MKNADYELRPAATRNPSFLIHIAGGGVGWLHGPRPRAFTPAMRYHTREPGVTPFVSQVALVGVAIVTHFPSAVGSSVRLEGKFHFPGGGVCGQARRSHPQTPLPREIEFRLQWRFQVEFGNDGETHPALCAAAVGGAKLPRQRVARFPTSSFRMNRGKPHPLASTRRQSLQVAFGRLPLRLGSDPYASYSYY